MAEDERRFIANYLSPFNQYLREFGVNDWQDPRHYYDYVAAFKEGYKPDLWETLPNEDRNEDILQAVSGKRTGKQMTPQEAVEFYLGSYMWSDKFKKPGHPVPPKE